MECNIFQLYAGESLEFIPDVFCVPPWIDPSAPSLTTTGVTCNLWLSVVGDCLVLQWAIMMFYTSG